MSGPALNGLAGVYLGRNRVPLRVGDAERDGAVQALGEHFVTGRLDRAEFDERSERAWAARTEPELVSLFADLPQPHGAVVPAYVGRRTPRPGFPPAAGRHRIPLGPLVFLAFVLAMVTHAFWLLFLVPMFFWFVVRPLRRRRG